jgi:hypothetical protein
VTAERLSAQLLSGEPAPDVLGVVRRLTAVQAQDPRGARLAIRARSSGVVVADVDRALTVDRSLVVAWLNRGTLHLVRSEDYFWLRALTAPPGAIPNARRLAQEGVSPEAAELGVTVVARALSSDGPLTREQLRDRLAAAGVPTRGQALVHVLYLASLREGIVRGPMAGREQAFVLARDWLGEPPPIERRAALAELARRYLAGHGPADSGDLAKWAGLGLREARLGLREIGPELDERPDGLVQLRAADRSPALPPPRLLGAFDPLLLGWRSREPVTGSHQELVTVNGLFRPFALIQGRAAGTWTLAGGDLTLRPFEPISPEDTAALQREADDVGRFLGVPVRLRVEDPADGPPGRQLVR